MPLALVGTAALLAAASSASFWALSMTIFPGFDLNAFLISEEMDPQVRSTRMVRRAKKEKVRLKQR
jgi:hypothetical protein